MNRQVLSFALTMGSSSLTIERFIRNMGKKRNRLPKDRGEAFGLMVRVWNGSINELIREGYK